jgi:dipeptide transport system ATP-binding protein
MSAPVVVANELTQLYSVRRGAFRAPATLTAVSGVSFALEPGSTLAVVGESGSGKSTLARMITLIESPSSGAVALDGVETGTADSSARRKLRTTVQMVFQNPYGSLNPRQRIRDALEEPLAVNTDMPRAERRAAAVEMIRRVGLRPEHADRYPHMFSGGQRQRIAIARALMLRPKVLVLDEPVSALDLSIRAQILNLLAELQQEFGLAYLFVSHDLSVVSHVADEVLVMYLGRSVEQGHARTVLDDPQHPYTRALLSATPSADPARRRTRIPLKGEPPSPFNPPSGCAFHPRCPEAMDICRVERPASEMKRGRLVACHAVSAA